MPRPGSGEGTGPHTPGGSHHGSTHRSTLSPTNVEDTSKGAVWFPKLAEGGHSGVKSPIRHGARQKVPSVDPATIYTITADSLSEFELPTLGKRPHPGSRTEKYTTTILPTLSPSKRSSNGATAPFASSPRASPAATNRMSVTSSGAQSPKPSSEGFVPPRHIRTQVDPGSSVSETWGTGAAPVVPHTVAALLSPKSGLTPRSPQYKSAQLLMEGIVGADEIPGGEENLLRELDNIHTGDDAVEFYARHGQESGVKFFYCNKADTGLDFRPYDLVVVSREEANPDYYTISSSGVMHIQPGANTQGEFTSLGNWMREKTLFNILRRIKFFCHYLVYKAFKIWHKTVRHKLYCQVRNKLTRRLFCAKPTFVAALMELRGHVSDIRDVKMMNVNPNHLHTLDEFADLQTNQRNNKATPALDACIEKVQGCLEKICRDVTKQARLYQESIRDENELDDVTGVNLHMGQSGDKSMSMVSIKQEKIERARTYRRVAEEANMLGDFIRLADYMLVEGLVDRAICTAEELLAILESPRLEKDKVSKGLLLTTVMLDDEGLVFTPTETDILQVFNNNLIEGMIGVVQAVPRLLYMRSFGHYFEGRVSGLNPVNIIRSTEYFTKLRENIDRVIMQDFAESRAYAKIFEEHRVIYEFGKTFDFDKYAARTDLGVHHFRADMARQKDWRNDLERMKIANVIGVLHVDSKSLRNLLMPITSRTLENIKGLLLTRARAVTLTTLAAFTARVKALQERPTGLDEFVAFMVLFDDMQAKKRMAMLDASIVDDMYEQLGAYEVKVPTADQVKLDDMHESVQLYLSALEKADEYIDDRKQSMMATLEKQIQQQNEELLAVLGSLHSGAYVEPDSDCEAVVADLFTLTEHIQLSVERSKTWQEYQRLFGMTVDDFSNLVLTEKECRSRYDVWEAVRSWGQKTVRWREGPLQGLNVAQVSEELAHYKKEAYRMGKANKDDQVVFRLKDGIDNFNVVMPLLEELANEALKPRHWEEIFREVNRTYDADAPFSLEDLLAWGIMNKMEVVTTISTNASKENSLEKALEKMEAAWEGAVFRVIAYKDTGTSVLGGVDDVQAILDDQIVKIQSMRASPFIKPFEARAAAWEDMLQTLQDLLDNWLKCQATWQYLEPIFSSADILKQMPEEGEKFQIVDAMWRDIMAKTARSPTCIVIAKDKERLERLEEANQLLDAIQKGLAAYLEVKRIAFPRFFFLSNDEMLEILSETKDPTRVQPHLKKCFEGIARLRFGKQPACEIKAMFSGEGEEVALDETIHPQAANGAVEKWLVEVETGMVASVRAQTSKAVMAYAVTPREQWVLAWPGQVVLVTSAIYWTREVGAALKDSTAAVAAYEKVCTEQLGRIVQLVRGDLPKLSRATLSALVVMDVHARDVVAQLARDGVLGEQSFDWQCQLRMYWENNTCQVRMMNASVEYGYEYLGNSSRLVITPLTDRCYRTLMGAIHLNLGGAPEGPAGTGKTETTKDLAKALARQCVVFNCSDSLDYLAMAKFFKGLAASGAWACFDEFNRIDLEVLSVVAQQVLEIQIAVQAKVKEFVFEGTPILLKPSCNVFITMNPGYAGRSELPDNLKALFRTVAMMVPDYALISEIILYSNGYLQARDCARKIVATYGLCSEQLSSQDHYDYGMRAVMAVLRAAANLKRRFPVEDELVLMLRSIIDVNLCKFLSHDVPLFNGIVSDLFPGVVLPTPDYVNLDRAMRANCAKLNLQPTEYFLTKVIQLYEMIVVRHGLMLVGLPFSGKTSSYKVLAGALTDLHEAGLNNEERVQISVVNPKSVTMGQLYGETDSATQEWLDGVLAVKFRAFAADQAHDRKWLVLDGPVDAIWIENMNTVLDDNKKLCLPNSEIIQMSSSMNMIFEVADLAVASPATVSRCGMVYLEPHQLGWRPLLESWLKTLPKVLQGEAEQSRIAGLFDWLMPPCLRWLRHSGVRELSPTLDANIAQAAMRLFAALFSEMSTEDDGSNEGDAVDGAEDAAQNANKPAGEEDAAATGGDKSAPAEGEDAESEEGSVGGAATRTNAKNRRRSVARGAPVDHLALTERIDCTFMLALVWSVGGTVDNAGRESFNLLFRSLATGAIPEGYERFIPAKHATFVGSFMPDDAGLSVYDFVYDAPACEWVTWTSRVHDVDIPAGTPFSDIIIPTDDSTRYTFLLDTAVAARWPLLFCGLTGVGKSVYVMRHLMKGLPTERYTSIAVAFSARTSANMTQDQIDGRLDKRRRGMYGPPPGKRCVIFVDDLNMPAKEVYGAQPPIELLRQFMDHGGWYGRDNAFREMIDVQFVAAMGPPGGGRNHVTSRYLRHFNMVGMGEVAERTLRAIFSSILKWNLTAGEFPFDVANMADRVIAATMDVYESAMRSLLPTPMKSHYTFNLRDFARVVQGIMLQKAVSVAGIDGCEKHAKLWVHEVMRVFYDRLTEEKDQEWLLSLIKTTMRKHFDMDFDQLFEHTKVDKKKAGVPVSVFDMRRYFIGNYMVEDINDREYGEVSDIPALLKTMDNYLTDYNGMSKRPMNLAIFLFAVEHVSRICRLLIQPGGNMLLVGVGGSGRQSLTRLAAFICGMDVHQVEISKSYTVVEWREDLKRMLRLAGGEGKETVFLFSDTQIKDEGFVEDLSNILNSGEVPNMFPNDEKAAVLETVRSKAEKAGLMLETQLELWAHFTRQCKQRLHVVFCMSPIGNAFRERLRQYPSLVNCCTIDWFQEWPTDALEAVAQKFLNEIDLDPTVRKRMVGICNSFHTSVAEASAKFYTETGRHNYVTPTSYLELISTYQTLLQSKRKEVQTVRGRYQTGLEKLTSSAEQVAVMQQELTDLKPKLITTVGDVEQLMKKIDKEKIEVVEPKKKLVQADEAVASKQAAEAKAIKDECEGALQEAMPILNEAIAALDTLKPADIQYVRNLKNPPAAVKLVMEAVCVVLDVKPAKVPDGTGKMVFDYWKPSTALLNDKDFLNSLKRYDKDNIPPRIIDKIRTQYVTNEDFTPEKAANASAAAEGLCKWVLAMDKYDKVAKVVAPKRERLQVAEAEYEKVMVALRAKQAELRKIMDKLALMEAQLAENQKKREQLEFEVHQCTLKLERAEKLIGGLGGEKVRWTDAASSLGNVVHNLTGDMLISAGVISYLGAFTSGYRQSLTEQWVALCEAESIPRSFQFSLQASLGEPVKIRAWLIAGLPNDAFSINNGIIVANARRWPLMIDPQGQANKWVKNKEKANNLQVIKLTEGGEYIRTLENAIQFGLPVLLENVGEELDPTLEPLLLRQVFKSGGVNCIRLGDATIEYSSDFRFYITTKMRNPHYLPETAVKVTLLNFMITLDGLSDQMLGVVVAKERPDLEAQKAEMVIQGAENKRKLKEIEDKILEVLSSSEGNILEDETAIKVISEAKEIANDINAKQVVAEQTEKEIDEARKLYSSCGDYTATLFFCISDLSTIEPMYQYSLPWFINLFIVSIAESERAEVLSDRLNHIQAHFTHSLYRNVCRSLFEKDKLLFSFLLTVRILQAAKQIIKEEWTFLLTGGLGDDLPAPNPAPEWLQDKAWQELLRLSQLPTFTGLSEHVAGHTRDWRVIYDSKTPESEPLPGPFGQLSSFRKLLILRCLRPDKAVPAVQMFVTEKMGAKYVDPPLFDLASCYRDSSSISPLIFVLSPGSDPMAALLRFAEEQGMQEKIAFISLGQGQGPKAAALIQDAVEIGSWVVLQNCHLAPSWMPALEKICEDISVGEGVNPEFRLWMTSYPSNQFPVSVLQNGVKMTNEPPKGLRANIRRSYQLDPICDDDFFNSSNKPDKFKRSLFGLVFFHAVVQERRKFGPLGWNIPYGFDDGDLRISVRQLKMLLQENEDVPWAALRYVTGECNYGGRVTDDKDRILINAILENSYNPAVLEDGYSFSPSGMYTSQSLDTRDEYLAYIEKLPIVPLPESFGLHENADITKDISDTHLMFESLLGMESAGGSGSGSGTGMSEEMAGATIRKLLAELPADFDIEAVQLKYPVLYEESMNTTLHQEMVRFNRLLVVIRSSLQAMDKALKGLVVMSSEMERAYHSLCLNQLPAMWKNVSYPSLKPLASYMKDLFERLAMLQSWYEHGKPPVYWLSGFFFVHSFTTAGLQNYARKNGIPIDMVGYDFEILGMDPAEYVAGPEDGVYVHGMYLEGCAWDTHRQCLTESQPKVLYVPAPVIWLRPCLTTQFRKYPHYRCPLYRTADRRGVLATTGHSTNFVMFVRLPTDVPSQHWIMRGVALLSSLSD
eukprot:jgi/Mesvir1/28709/Mv19680-RA.1